MKQISLWLLLCSFSLFCSAQVSKTKAYGRLVDQNDGSLIIGATVQLYNLKDSSQSKYAVTNLQGIFLLTDVERAFYKLNVKSLGYKPYSRTIRVIDSEMNFGNILLEQDQTILEGLEIEGSVVAMEQKGDTTLYNADAYKVNPDASTMDLVSKMPGIVVNEDGVTADGETIEQVLLDGKRFFGQDPLLSLNTIPAEIVDRVEVYDQQSERSQFTGYDDGNTTKTMNVVTKEDKRNGLFGKLYGGYGADNHYQSGLTMNSFQGDQRLTILGLSNDINQQNFSDEDLAQVSGGQRRGFRRGSDNTLMTGTQDGITQTHSFGSNYTDDLGDKVKLEGSYFFNQTDNYQDELTNREIYLGDSTQYYSETQNSETENLNHRLNGRITYDINDKNSLRIIPKISYQKNESIEQTSGNTTDDSTSELINQTDNTYTSVNEALNVDNYVAWMHKLGKIGRTTSLEIQTQYMDLNRENYYEDLSLDSSIRYNTDDKDYMINTKLGYTEPVGNTAELSASYEMSYQNRVYDKETYLQSGGTATETFSELLSSEFESSYTAHRTSIRLSNRNYGTFYHVGATLQYAELNNYQSQPGRSQLTKNYLDLLPYAMARFDVGKDGNVFLSYRTSTSIPSVDQLQNVMDNSDPLFLSEGNPDLDQSYSHRLTARFRKRNVDKNTSISSFVNVQTTRNYMTNSTVYAEADSLYPNGVVVQQGAQISSPINLNGYWRFQSNTTHSVLLNKLKSNLNTTLGLTYTRTPGKTNDELNIVDNYSLRLRFALASNFSEKIDFNFYYEWNPTLVKNSIQSTTNTSYSTQTVAAKSNLIFGKGIVFRNDVYFQEYNGVDESFDSQYILWNMSVAKKLFDKQQGEIELSVFDLLGQNQSFSQNINASYTEEVRTEVLRQYLMLTFTYQLRSFK